jgi:hypothetical protein
MAPGYVVAVTIFKLARAERGLPPFGHGASPAVAHVGGGERLSRDGRVWRRCVAQCNSSGEA